MNDENMKVIACGCGQKNHLILLNGVWVFDEKKHGKYVYPPGDETAKGCINCHKPFPLTEGKVIIEPPKPPENLPATKEKKKK